jgi:chromosome segregation ATPase
MPGHLPVSDPVAPTAPLATPAYAAPPAGPTKTGINIPLLFGAVLALLAATVYLFIQVGNLRSELGKTHDSMLAEIEKVREASAVSSQSHRRTIDALRDQVERERRLARSAVGEAKTEALRKMEDTKALLQSEQQKAQQQAQQQIAEVKTATDTANTKIGEVGTEVTAVKSDVATTKSELEKTVADLKRTNGDVNGQGVLIATNAKELSALRQLGERNYLEFNIKKAKQAQKVGDVMVLLKKADPKKNRYTIELTADDKTVEKKDRGVNEPLQFLVAKARQPYEIVVNDIKKDQIVGYLSVPKVQNARN